MDELSPSLGRWLLPALLLALGALALLVEIEWAREPREAPVARADAPPPPSPGWREASAGSPFAGWKDLAASVSGALVTDGHTAHMVAASAVRPLEVPAAIPRVFAAADRFFASGDNDGAPFLIALGSEQSPVVVPVPCSVSAIAGSGDQLVVACQGLGSLALSVDAARTFQPLALPFPAPEAPSGSAVAHAVEGLAMGADGLLAIAVSQSWQTQQAGERIRWSWAQIASRPARGAFRFVSLPGVTRLAALKLDGTTITAAALESPGEGGELHPQLYRGPEGQLPSRLGGAGPACGATEEASGVQVVLLGDREAAFLCHGQVVLTVDEGRTWLAQSLPIGRVERLRGGAMRLWAQGDGKSLELALPLRLSSGAVGARLAAQVDADAGSGPLVPGAELVEPAQDAGISGQSAGTP